MKQFRSTIAAITVAGFITASAGEARAYGNVSCSTTWTVVGLVTTAGIAVLIYFLVIKKPAPPADAAKTDGSSPPPSNPPPPPPAAPGAMLFLRDTGPQFAEDLALGEGPMLTDLADALEVPAEHRTAFNHALCAQRAHLLDLADPARLTPDRSVEFLGAVMAALNSDRTLAADVADWTVRMDARVAG